jgi:hypothetical protein
MLCAYQTGYIAARHGFVDTMHRGTTCESGFGDMGESVLREVGTEGLGHCFGYVYQR